MCFRDFFFFFQAEDGIRDKLVTGVQTCALPIWPRRGGDRRHDRHRRHAGAGGHGHPARGRAAHPGLRRARRAVGPGDRPHQGLPHRGGRRHQLDRGVAREACGGPGDRADRGAAARRGHSTDPRRGIRLDAIRLDTRTKEPVMNTPEITVKRREGTGKGIARRLRRDGVVPAILYGGAAPETIAVNPRDVLRIIHGREGTTQLLSLKVEGDGGARMAIIRDMQFDPVTERLLHVDIQEVRADRAITVRVAVHPVGEAIGVKDTKGILNLVLHEITVACLPRSIPERIDADVSNLAIGDVLTIANLQAPEGVRIINDPGQAVATVAPPMAEEVATPAATAAVTAEPEVLTERKPKEGEEAAPAEGDKKAPAAKTPAAA